MKAFQAFLRAVPDDSGLSYLLIQHLDPSHPTELPELLQRETRLPVLRAANGASLQPGKVYVVPEGRVATLEDGVLKLRLRESEREQPIDALFSSLAVAPATACAVLLSGLGADGVQGMREIAATGGIVFVQDPGTAQHPEMPRAAIEAGLADFVGSPEAIAARLNEIASRLGVAVGTRGPAVEEPAEEVAAVEAILGLLERETGADFHHYKASTMRRRIGRRAVLRDARTLADYLDVLRNDAGEVPALLADLLINVTQFFRDEEVFSALKARIFPEMIGAKQPGEPLRIWVPGCSTGEEVYSLLIALLETLGDAGARPPITVFGTDLSESALRRARAGVYAEDTCAYVSPERLERFFHRVEQGYEIDKSLREMCVFARQDITRDTPFSRLDLISLRNVLIYMDQHLQRVVLSVAHYALLPHGFLVLGTAESAESESRLFETFDKQRHIYRRADVPPSLPHEVTGGGRPFEAPSPRGAAPTFDVRRAADEVTLAAFAPPRLVVDADGRIVEFFGDTQPYVAHAEGRATLDAVDMAVPGLALDLRDALRQAEDTNALADREATFTEDGRERRVLILVEPLPSPAGRYRLVAFRELPPSLPPGEKTDVAEIYEAREERLRQEVAALRGRMRYVAEEKDQTNEELRTANEEIQSSNEELQSLNEELETAKEELQSANEELITVNEELRQRNVSLAQTNDDLNNFFSSTAIPVIMLDRQFKVRRYTPEAQRVAHIGPEDEGRDLAQLRMRVDVPDLQQLAQGVVEDLGVCEREVRDESGRWYSMEIRPYRTSKNAVEGVVLSFFDIDELRRSMERVAKRARLSEALAAIDTDISSSLEFDEIMHRALDRAVAAVDADAGTIEIREGDAWVVRYQNGFETEDVGTRLTDEEAPNAVRAATERRPFSISDMSGDDEVDVGFVRKYGLRSVLAVPLLVKGDVIGSLLLYGRGRARSFGRSEMDFAGRLGASVSLALENARLIDEERRAARSAQALAKVNEILLAAITPDEVIARLVGEVSEVAGADKSLVIELRDGSYVVTHVRNVRDDLVGVEKDASFYPGFHLAASQGRPLLIADTLADPRTNKDFVEPYGLRAFQLMPVAVHDEVVAVLAFAWERPRAFSAEDEEFAERMSLAMSTALSNARLYESEIEAQHQAQLELETTNLLLNAADALAGIRDLDEMLHRLADILLESASHSRVTVDLWDADRRELRVVVSEGERPIPSRTYAYDEISSVARDVIASAKPSVIDYEKLEGEAISKAAATLRARLGLIMPMVYQGGVLGLVLVDAPGERQSFSDREVALIRGIADEAAVAIENARLFEAEQAARRAEAERAQRITALSEIAQESVSSLDLSEVASRVLAKVGGLLDAKQSQLRLLTPDGTALAPVATVDPSDGFLANAGPMPVEAETETAECFRTRQPRVGADITEAVTEESRRNAQAAGVRSYIIVPVLAGDAAIGTLYVAWAEPRDLEPDQVSFVQAVAAQFALGLQNARLFEQQRATSERLSDVLDSMSDGFMSLDRQWRYTMVNPRMAKMIDRPAEELLGRSMLEEYPDAAGIPYFRRTMDERVPQFFETWSPVAQRWLEIHAYPTEEGISILFSDISTRKASEERIREQTAIMEGTAEILQAALTTATEEELGDVCLEVASRLSGSPFGFMDEIGPDGLLHDIAMTDPGWAACEMYDKEGHRRPPGDFKVHGLYGKVFAEAKPFFTNDPSEEPESIGTPEGHPPLTAFLGVPLLSRGGATLGVINVANKEGGYAEGDVRTLEAIAPVIVEAFERKRAERESAIAKERLDAHIDNSPLAVIEFDSGFRITRWSDEAEKMFGWSADEVLGKAIGEFKWVYEEDTALVDQESRSLLTAANPRSLNVNRNYRKDGSLIWCEWYDSAIYDSDGNLVSILSQVLDITERRNAEEALAKTTRRVEILGESARLLLTTESPESVVQTVGEEVMRFLDCQVFFNYLTEEGSEVMRLNAYAGIPAKEAAPIAHLGLGDAVCGCVGREGCRIVVEDVQHTPDERTELVKSYGVQAYACHPLVYQGETIGTLSFGARDRTRFADDELEMMKLVADQAATAMARKKAEDGIRASEQRYRLLFANMLDGFAYCSMIYDEAGKPVDFVYLDVNEAFDTLTGLHGVVGKRVSEVIPGVRDSNPEILEVYARVAGGAEPEHFETELDQLGRAFSIGVYSPLPGHFVAIFHNISEQKARQRMDEALDEIRTAIGSTLDLDEIMHELAERAGETLKTETMQIILAQGDRWVVKDAHGLHAHAGDIYTDEHMPLARAAVTGDRPVVAIDSGGRGSKQREAMRRFGVGALLVIPLLAQGRGIGVIGVGRRRAERFSDLEMYFASRLTSTAALALDNALAYERERTIADTLQEAMLTPPPPIPGIEMSYQYKAASAEAAVGGDFYDVFEMDGGKVGVVVGDVSGKGLEAARLTSLVRDGIRAYALENDDPAWVLGHVNSLMYRSSPVESFATLFFGVLDVLSGRLQYTSAGHPPAVVCGGGVPRFLEETPAALLGAFGGAAFTSAEAKVGKDEVLVLYTDGVIEARRSGEMYGDERLIEALRRLGETPFALLPQALLDDVLAFSEGSLRDDTVIVCIRRALD